MNEREYVLGQNVRAHAAPSEPPSSSILALEMELATDLLARLDALSAHTGRSIENIVEAALAEYAPLRREVAPRPSRRARPAARTDRHARTAT